jgi:heat shock protein HslJ
MIKEVISVLLLITTLFFSGCNSGANTTATDSSAGPSSGSEQSIGSMSGGEDISAYLEDDRWTSITLDLDKYLYDTQGSTRAYSVEMDFKEGKVTVLADCNHITASYKIKEDRISFSRVSSPKPAIDLPTCTEFKDADNAVVALFSSEYVVKPRTLDELVLEATDIETSVTLTR